MDKFASLNAFSQVAQAGSFAAAARRAGVSRSQVNRAVIALEDALGVQLFNRTTRSVALTPSGRAFHQRCSAILADLAEAERLIRSEQETPQGEMRINAPMSFGTLHLAPAITEFMRRYPQVRVQLDLSDRFVDPVAEGFDVTVRIAAARSTPSLIDHQIVEVRLAICASPAFLAAHGTPQAVGDLARLPCLCYGDLAGGTAWRLVGPEGTVEVRVNGTLSSNNGEALRDAAVAGLGVALLPTFIAGRELQAGRLVTVLPEHAPPPLSLSLIYPPNRHLSPRIRAFVQFMHQRFGDRPYWDLVE